VQESGDNELNTSLGGESICEKVGGEKYHTTSDTFRYDGV
jgi:hypothetical protein